MNRARHAAVLWILLGLFCVRVIAQLLQAVSPVAFLPPFAAWQSGALSYASLLAAQAVIIAGYGATAYAVGSGRATPNRRVAASLYVVGAVYFGLMLVRLALGVTALDGHPWWDRPIPAAFHLVLAGFLLVVAHFFGQTAPEPEQRAVDG